MSDEQRGGSMMRCMHCLLFFACFICSNLHAQSMDQVADAHRQRYPRSEWGHHYYIRTDTVPRSQRRSLAQTLAFVVASCSPQTIMERCTPGQVDDFLWHIDLRDMQWRWQDWRRVLQSYPYASHDLPLVVRADWLIVHLTDASEHDSYYRLLHRGEVPATRDAWLAHWKVSEQKSLRFGLIEAQSGVSKQRTRWIENRPRLRGYAWGTRDVARLTAGADPLEALDGKFRHDAEEWILGVPKVSVDRGTRGTLQIYLLTDGAGRRVDEADTNVVEDSTRFRDRAAVRTAGSCMTCHDRGLNYPTINELRRLISSGVDVYAGKAIRDQIELFHLTDVGRDIKRANEDFARGVAMCNGLDPTTNAEALAAAVRRYDATVDLRQAAVELNATTAELRLALAYAGSIGARLAGLAHEQPLPRSSWESHYHQARQALAAWRTSIQRR